MIPADGKKEEILALYKQALVAREKEAAQKLVSDRRGLTLADMAEAMCCLDMGKDMPSNIRKKIEKDDPRLYGVVLPDDKGTGGTIIIDERGRQGSVVKVEMVDGYNEFIIKWSGKHKDSTHCLDHVLKYGQGVVSLENARKRTSVFFKVLSCYVNVHVHKIVTEDTEVEFKKPTPKLNPRELDINGVMKARKSAWDEISKTRAVDMLNPHEIKLLDSKEDPGLVGELEKDKSCLDMMGLARYRDTNQLGLVDTAFKFHKKHLPKVNHYIRGAQVSFKLGRLTNLASSIMFMSVNEIPPGSKAIAFIRDSPDEGKPAIFTPVDVEKYSLMARALLERARVPGHGEGCDTTSCQWLQKYPLYRFSFLSRPDGRTVAPNSENINVCQTRRQKDAFKTVAQMMGGHWDKDVALFDFIDQSYLLTARGKKNASSQRETENKGVGLGARVIKGKMHLVGSTEMVDGVDRLLESVFRNVIYPFMEKLPDRRKNVDMCMDVLLQHKRRVGVEEKDKNEDHLYPEVWRGEIDAIVDHMIVVKGVTRVEVSLLSRALVLADNHTAAALRDEDTRGQNACDVDAIEIPGVSSGEKVKLVRCELPPFFKNRKAMQKKKTGYPVNHVKDERCEEPFVVMVVIARRIMRKLLQVVWEKKEKEMRNKGKIDIEIDEETEKHTLTEKLGPFSPLGQLYSSKQLATLYEFCGAYAMGLPYYKSHVIRSIHATAVAKLCIRHGLAEDHPDTLKIFNAARQGDDERISAYSQAMSDMPNRDGITHRWRSANSALSELRNPEALVAAGSKENIFQEFERVSGFQVQVPCGESIPVNIGVDERCDDHLNDLERKCRELELLARIQVLERQLGMNVGEVLGPMDNTGADGCSGISKGVKRKEEGQSNPRRKNKKGTKMQDKFDRRSRLVAEMNRLFVEWARLYRTANPSPKKKSNEAVTKNTINRSRSISVVFAKSVTDEMVKMNEHVAFLEEFFEEFNSSTGRRNASEMVTWENP